LGSRGARCSSTAVFGEETQERVHLVELRRVDHGSTLAVRGDKTRHAEPIKMKREGVWREVERGRHRSRCQTLRSRLYEQTKHVESIILSERCQSSHGIYLIHISTNIEHFVIRQCIWQAVKDKPTQRSRGDRGASPRWSRTSVRAMSCPITLRWLTCDVTVVGALVTQRSTA
jgi:hypothetical protein